MPTNGPRDARVEQHRHLHLPPRLVAGEHLAADGWWRRRRTTSPPRLTVSKSALSTFRKHRPVPSSVRFSASGPANESGVGVGEHPPAGERAVAGRNVDGLLGGQVNHPARRGLGEGRVEVARSAGRGGTRPALQVDAGGVVGAHQNLGLRAFRVVARGHQFVGDLGDDELLIQRGERRASIAAPSSTGRITRRVGMPAESCGSSSLFRCIHATVNVAAISVIGSASRSNTCGTRKP